MHPDMRLQVGAHYLLCTLANAAIHACCQQLLDALLMSMSVFIEEHRVWNVILKML